MRARKGSWIVGLLALVACGLLAGPPVAMAAAKVALAPEDCVKCHEAPPADVAEGGGKHKSDVTCLDCHAGHRPASKGNIPKCAQCHEGKPHYALKNCLECHKNPHKPVQSLVLAAKTTEPCLTCHTDQNKQLKENPSKHSGQYCTNCHDVHRKIPDCVKCHRPHSAEMAQGDCKKCHKAHKPKAVAYGADVPNKDCGACHKQALALLSATATKHRSVACVKCHENRHKAVPDCQQCHGSKHPAAMMKKFPKCGTCHNVAHDLNHWPEGAPPEKEKAGKAKAGKKKQ
jgi:predicted CXXCH cytochrome family protein